MAKDAAPSLEGQKTPSSASSATGGNTGSSSSGGTDQQQPYSGSVVTLVSMDGDGFVVESSAIMVSKLLDAMLDGPSENDVKEIPLPNMRSNVVAKVVEFCQHNKMDPMTKIPKPIQYGKTVSDHVQEWYSTFVQGLGDEMLFELLLAGNYLDLPPLLELCAATVGLRAMNKTPDEVRSEFNIKEAFSPEVERTLRDENKWSTEPPIGS
ncbi:unnamed protein product [Pylaiella littoralis]